MKQVVLKLGILLVPAITLFLVVVFFKPPTKAFRKSMFYSVIDKNQLLKETPNPRIIFIGGSNLSFGLNSKIIKDSLGLNPINLGVHASLGLKYMLASSIMYVRENDIIVVSPEYQQFYNRYADGGIELLATIVDVVPQTVELLDYKQYFRLLGYIPKLAKSKLNLFEKENNDTVVGIYDRRSFNSYGDVYKHWGYHSIKSNPFAEIEGKMDQDPFEALIRFKDAVKDRKAKLFIAFPCYQEQSFKNSIREIKEVEQELKECGFNLLSIPERYAMPDSLIFGSPYHLIKMGVDIRTRLLIEDLNKAVHIKVAKK